MKYKMKKDIVKTKPNMTMQEYMVQLKIKNENVCIQGQNANVAGQKLEQFVENTLVEKGAFSVSYSKWTKGVIKIPKGVEKVLYKQVPYTKPWGDNGRSDFVIKTPDRTIRIEVRSQAIHGSVEEKNPYLILVARECFPEKETIIVLDGPAVKKSIRTWLIGLAKKEKKRKILVLDKTQFKAWADENI